MKVIERLVQHIHADKWAELEAIDKEFNALEAKHGFPPKRRSQLFSGSDEYNTLIVEYVWESLAAMEAAYESINTDPAYMPLYQKVFAILRDSRVELYTPLP